MDLFRRKWQDCIFRYRRDKKGWSICNDASSENWRQGRLKDKHKGQYPLCLLYLIHYSHFPVVSFRTFMERKTCQVLDCLFQLKTLYGVVGTCKGLNVLPEDLCHLVGCFLRQAFIHKYGYYNAGCNNIIILVFIGSSRDNCPVVPRVLLCQLSYDILIY